MIKLVLWENYVTEVVVGEGEEVEGKACGLLV